MNRPFSWTAALGGLTLLTILSGCGGSGGDNTVNTPVPSQDVFTVTTGGTLIRLDNVGFANMSAQPLAGLAVGDNVVGMDFRPANGALYILGSSGQLYTVNTNTFTAMPVGAPIAMTGAAFGFDFNPSVDRIRVTSSTNENFRIHPDTGALVAMDSAITPGGVYASAAYTPAGAGQPTTLYALESTGGQLGTIGGIDGNPSPNGGAFSAIANLSINVSSETHFDVDSDGNAFFSTWDGAVTRIYYIDVSNGDIDEIGQTNLRMGGLTIIP